MASSRRRSFLFALSGLALVAALIVCFALSGEDPAARLKALVDEALHGESLESRETAVSQLASMGLPAAPSLRKVLQETSEPSVRAAAVQGLAIVDDWDSVPLIIACLDDSSVVVRGRAGAAMARFLGRDYFFRADDPLPKRVAVAARIKACYQEMAESPPPRYRSRTDEQ